MANSNLNVTFKYLKPWILANFNAHLTPALLGEPGIGKTAFLESMADELKTKVFVLSVNQLAAKEDLTGARLVPTTNKDDYEQKFYPHQVINQAITYAKDHPDESPILFMDEFNRTESDVTSALFTMITERRIGNRLLPENLRLCVAGNDSGNVQSIDDASTTRLVIYHVKPDMDTLLSSVKFNYYVNDVLMSNPSMNLVQHEATNIDMPENTNDDDDDYDDDDAQRQAQASFMEMLNQDQESFKQMTTPRTIEAVSKQLDSMGITGVNPTHDAELLKQYASDMVSFKNVLYGITGQTVFTSKLIDRLTSVFTAQTIKPMNRNQPKPAITKLPNNFDSLFNPLKDKDNNDIADLLSDRYDYDSLNTIFNILVSPNVANNLIQHNINPQLQQMILLNILTIANHDQDLTNLLMSSMRSYLSSGFSSTSGYVFNTMNDDNKLKQIYNVIIGN